MKISGRYWILEGFDGFQYRRQIDSFLKLKINSQYLMSLQLNCPQCKEIFSSDNPPKALINCCHNICLKCIQQQILCPVDRVRIQLRRFTLEAFKTNQVILNKIEKARNSPEVLKSARSKKSSSAQKLTSKDKKIRSSSKKLMEGSKTERQIAVVPFEQITEPEPEPQQPEAQQFIPSESKVSQRTFKSPIIERKQSQSPKKPVDNFETCLLHSKKADLICMEDKCLICANCGLFGQHKHHKIIPFEEFLNQYSLLTEQCFKNYEELQSREDKMDLQLISEQVTSMLNERKSSEMKQIRTFIRELNQIVKKVEKQLVSNLDLIIAYKKRKILEEISFKDLQGKKQEFMSSVERMTLGLEHLFNLQQVESYVPYIDPNDAHSYVLEEGEYLIRQIDNYSKMVQQKIEYNVAEFKYVFEPVSQDIFSSFISISSAETKQINDYLIKHKNNMKETPARSRTSRDSLGIGKQTRVQQKSTSPQKQNQDNTLLLGLDSGIQSPRYHDISPIQPLTNVLNIQFAPQNSCGPESFFKMADSLHPDFISSKNYRKSTGKPPVNKSFNPSKTTRHARLESCESELSHISIHHKSKPKSNNNSNHLTERQLLNVLNEKSDNKKKKKLDLPQKYAKIYDDLHKDRLDVVDLGGAFLGDSKILAISQLFLSSRGKLKQIKLMNNKISDDIFAELISRCRNVSSLNLSYNTLTEKCLDWLEVYAEHLGDLRNITLSNNKIVLRNNRERIDELKRRGLNVSL